MYTVCGANINSHALHNYVLQDELTVNKYQNCSFFTFFKYDYVNVLFLYYFSLICTSYSF